MASILIHRLVLLSPRLHMASWAPGQPHQAESETGIRAALLRGRADSGRAPKRSKRPTPGFRRQFAWCLSRVALQRTREPLLVVTDYAIFALTGHAPAALIFPIGNSPSTHTRTAGTIQTIVMMMTRRVKLTVIASAVQVFQAHAQLSMCRASLVFVLH